MVSVTVFDAVDVVEQLKSVLHNAAQVRGILQPETLALLGCALAACKEDVERAEWLDSIVRGVEMGVSNDHWHD